MRTLIYQIFVDRFAGEGGRPLSPPPPGVDPWRHHAGGTLDGIVARLDHIVSLGADALYLTPIGLADSNHKYDGRSYEEVDPAFGGDRAFAALAEACRARGLGLILDLVLNHVGDQHPWFRSAVADPSAPHARFFKFTRHPDDYARWRGYGSLPELDLTRDEVREALVEGERSVVRSWLRRGATGLRLDCANDLGFDLCARVTRVAREASLPDGVIGEVMAYAADWVAEGRLDAVMNYWFREAALGFAAGVVPGVQAAHNLALQAERYPASALLRSWNVLSTHDTPRLATMVEDPAARRLALALAFAAPGTPLLYYGEEVGMRGGPDPDNRAPMIWDETAWDRVTLEWVRGLARVRRARPALRVGAHLDMPQPGRPKLLVFARTTPDPEEVVVVIANGSPEPTEARVFLPYSYLFDALPLRDLLTDREVARVHAGRVDLRLAPWEVLFLAPQDGTFPGYRFFRPR